MGQQSELSFRTRKDNVERLSAERFDLLVIGGGITGAGIARDAALRGLSVALVERKDFAAGTSSRSSKLVHGGLRYLQQGDVGLVREAATERYVLHRLAPHLARPERILVPVPNRRAYAKIKLGLWTYDRLAHVVEEEKYRMISRDEALEREPLLRPDELYGAGLYYEYLTDDARLVIEVIKSAAALGAVVANHAEVTGFRAEHGRLTGVNLRDAVTGADLSVCATVIINAAGPWVDLLRLTCEPGDRPRLRLTKGIHIGLRRKQLPVSHIVIMSARDGRGVFAVPHGQVTYLGTTDTFYDGPEDYPVITMKDVNYLLEAVQRSFLIDAPTPEDIVSAWAGLRPLLAEEGKKPTEISRKDEIMVSPSGLISIAGGKLTTFRCMAERVVDQVIERLREAGVELPDPVGASAEVPLSGGAAREDVTAYTERLKAAGWKVDGDVIDHLAMLYGSNAEHILAAIRDDPSLAERCVSELPVTRAEVQYVVRHEMATTLEDVLERRTRLLLWDPENGVEAAETVARWIAEEMSWDRRQKTEEVAAYRSLAVRLRTFAADLSPAEARVQAAPA